MRIIMIKNRSTIYLGYKGYVSSYKLMCVLHLKMLLCIYLVKETV